MCQLTSSLCYKTSQRSNASSFRIHVKPLLYIKRRLSLCQGLCSTSSTGCCQAKWFYRRPRLYLLYVKFIFISFCFTLRLVFVSSDVSLQCDDGVIAVKITPFLSSRFLIQFYISSQVPFYFVSGQLY